MLDPRIGRSLLLIGWLAGGLAPARGELPPGPPFAIPKDRAEWEGRRPGVAADAAGADAAGADAAGRSRGPNPWRLVAGGPGGPGPAGLVVERVERDPPGPADPRQGSPRGAFVLPAAAGAAGRVPLVLLIGGAGGGGGDPLAAGWDGRPAAAVLARSGYAVLAVAGAPARSLRDALDAVLARPEVDPARVAVFALGHDGLAALELMALDPRITCGVVGVEAIEAGPRAAGTGDGPAGRRPAPVEELVALCAPRPLWLMVGEALPLPPAARSVGRRLERAAKGTYKVYGKEGTKFTFNLFGEFAGHDSVATRLQWMAGLEHLDKTFRPQVPTPLGHPAAPEPAFDPAAGEVLDLTAAGIAGWSPEMSGRDSTWSWSDGVVACRPKANEYGWLRCPVEVDDFLLQVEWKVPERGNAGIFLRARPVDWVLPPTEENRLRIGALGLTWPSRTGLELQAQADPGEANRYSTGSIYRHAAPAANPTRSPDHWNRSTVRARGTRVEVWNNGQQVLDADLARADDTLPVPPLRGYIGLQNHGAPADYRAIRLRRLAPGAAD